MSFSVADIERLAALARLAVVPAEAERLAAELSTILEHVAALRTAELHDALPLGGMAEACAAPRADVPDGETLRAATGEPLADATVLSADADAGFFTVPRGAAREP